MADERRSTESERHPERHAERHWGAESQERVDVFDVAGAGIRQHDTTTGRDQHTTNGMNGQGNAGADNVGFNNADLQNARVVTSDAEPTSFRTTDLRETELNTTSGDNANRNDSVAGQGTNWGTILMVIAIILVIILLGSWLF